jgi:PAS domain S-box-containing protein
MGKRKKYVAEGANVTLNILRDEAEKMLRDRSSYNDDPTLAEGDIKRLFQELQVHQLELEMQNDELRKANEELEMQRIKFAGIYDLAPVGYFIIDRLGIIEEVNSKGLDLLQASKHLLLKSRFQSFIMPHDLDKFYQFQQNMLKTQVPQSCQVKVRTKTNGTFHAQLEGIAINNMMGVSTQCYIAMIDISERINAQQILATTKERLELALEASSAGTWEVDLKTNRFFLDDSSHAICGLDPNTFDGRYETFLRQIHPDDRSKVDEHFRYSMNNEREINIDFCVLKLQDEVAYVSARGHIIGDEKDARRLVGTIMDVTEKKLLEKETNELRLHQHRNITAAILQAQENERKRISGALHDSVSQLLYGIKLNLQQVDQQRIPETNFDNIKKLLDEAIKETRNISFELAPSILTDFGLSVTVKEMAKRLSTDILTIKVSIDIEHRLKLPLEINIFRILQELLNNCIKHSDATSVHLGIKQENKLIHIRVKDNGKGFDTGNSEKLSEGSGLSSIRNRLSLFDGTIHIQSQPYRGTIVHITLNDIQ